LGEARQRAWLVALLAMRQAGWQQYRWRVPLRGSGSYNCPQWRHFRCRHRVMGGSNSDRPYCAGRRPESEENPSQEDPETAEEDQETDEEDLMFSLL